MQTDATAASSTATTETASVESSAPAIETWSSAQRTEWLKTGKTPEAPKPAESAPAPPKENTSSEASAVEHEDETTAPDSDPGDRQEQPPAKKMSPAEKRIKQLLARQRELEEALEATRKPAEEKRSDSKPSEQPAQGKPKQEDFKTYDEYFEALAEWKAEQRIAQRDQQREAKEAEARARAAEAEVAKSWKDRVAKTKAAHPDFDAVFADADMDVTPVMQKAMLASEHGAEVAYHLAKHPEESERIAGLSNYEQALAIGEIISSIKAAAAKSTQAPPKKTTSASKPPTELASKATPPADEAEAALADGDFARYRRIMNSRSTGKAA